MAFYANCLDCSAKWFAKKLIIVHFIKDENPIADLFVLKPVANELATFGSCLRNFSSVGQIAKTFS
ncbi:uncharacterized protein N7473_008783 [Penicillium subrubescens]|uniref:uncharacterized protein n=1 Tax=Penicillium subrubescens TaxID=1316194 RepID=UPI002545A2B8|nr:uncharacterized protein N7473_008783 [Penicillium subrubescens]KAJ5886109.1 hypothetical protein N7473_008783 [Penicillium subrubescens]